MVTEYDIFFTESVPLSEPVDVVSACETSCKHPLKICVDCWMEGMNLIFLVNKVENLQGGFCFCLFVVFLVWFGGFFKCLIH